MIEWEQQQISSLTSSNSNLPFLNITCLLACGKVCSNDLQASNVKIADIMSKIQMSAQANTPIEVAVQRMINNKIRRLPVMESGKIVGIITVTDMAKELRNTLLMDGVLSVLSEG